MPAASDRQFPIFIHGVGGACPTEQWLSPLSDVMAQLGHSRPESSGIKIITVDYRAALLDPAAGRFPRRDLAQ